MSSVVPKPSSFREPVDDVRAELLSSSRMMAVRVQRLARLLGFAWWLLFAVAALLVLVTLDVVLRREELGLRFLSIAVWIGVLVWAGWRYLYPVWRLSPTPLQMARWIERGRPDLGERLSTAVQIAETDANDERFGSAAFRNAVLDKWREESHKPNWNAYIDHSRLWQAAGMVGILLLGSAAALLIRPAESRLALSRFFQPWSAPAWPRRDQLEFVNLPGVAAIDSELQVEVSDRNAPLPPSVVVQLRLADDPLSRVMEIPTSELDAVAVANLPPLSEAIEVRAVGGDDQTMAWQRVDVVAPPQLEKYQFLIEPPEYSGRTASELIGTRIQALVGSSVLFKGEFDQPIRAAELVPIDLGSMGTPNDTSATNDGPLVVKLSGNPPRSISIGGEEGTAIELKQSVAWRLQVETLDGLQIELPQRWTIDVVDDTPPTAVLVAPSLAELTANGQLQIQGLANDDVGLESLAVMAQVDGAAGEPVSRQLWANGDELTTETTVDEVWDVTAVLGQGGISPEVGQVLNVWLEAKDQLGQIGRSAIERLEVKSPEAVATALMERQERVLQQLREMVMVQRRNQQMTERTEQQLRTTESVAQADIDTLNGVAQSQSALAGQLSGQQDSLLEQTSELERMLRLNRLESGAAAKQISQLQRDLQSIASGEMEQASSAAAAAHREAAELLADKRQDGVAATIEQLAASSQAQADVLMSMENLADRLNHSGGLQQVQRDLTSLAERQAMLLEETETLQLEQLRNNRPDAVEAASRAAASEQEALAQQLDGLLDRSRELTAGDQKGNEALGEAIRSAVNTLGENQTSRLMHQAADEIGGAELTDAMESQRQAANALAEAMRGLEPDSGRSRSDAMAQQAENLRERRDAVANLADSQQQLAEELARANAGDAQRLADQQSTLADATQQQSQLAEQQGDADASQQLDSVGDAQSEARSAAEEQQMRAAAKAARQAAEELSQLAQELKERANELSRQSQLQRMYRLEDSLQRLVDQQQPIVTNIQGLSDRLVDDPAAPAANVEQAARGVAVDQEAIRQRLLELRQEVGEMPAFDWTLDKTSQDMAKAVAAAERFRIAPDALTAASDALRKLELTLEAVQTAANQSEAGEESGAEQPQQDGEPQSESAFPPLASLKLLRGLQQELNAQTQQLDDEVDVARKNRRMNELAEQQQSLGKQLEALLRAMLP